MAYNKLCCGLAALRNKARYLGAGLAVAIVLGVLVLVRASGDRKTEQPQSQNPPVQKVEEPAPVPVVTLPAILREGPKLDPRVVTLVQNAIQAIHRDQTVVDEWAEVTLEEQAEKVELWVQRVAQNRFLVALRNPRDTTTLQATTQEPKEQEKLYLVASVLPERTEGQLTSRESALTEALQPASITQDKIRADVVKWLSANPMDDLAKKFAEYQQTDAKLEKLTYDKDTGVLAWNIDYKTTGPTKEDVKTLLDKVRDKEQWMNKTEFDALWAKANVTIKAGETTPPVKPEKIPPPIVVVETYIPCPPPCYTPCYTSKPRCRLFSRLCRCR